MDIYYYISFTKYENDNIQVTELEGYGGYMFRFTCTTLHVYAVATAFAFGKYTYKS